MKPAINFLLFLSLWVIVGSAQGQSRTIEQINAEENIRETMDSIDGALRLIDEVTHSRKVECIKAFGHESFCECINKGLAVMWSFSDYIAITTLSKKDTGYESFEPDVKVAYDNAIGTRNKCVSDALHP